MEIGYAGFWKRFAAFIIDMVITTIIAFLIGFIIAIIIEVLGFDSLILSGSIGNFLGMIITWIYYAVMESSKLQASLGKLALSIKVTNLNGDRISFARATGRHFGKIISTIVLLVGFIMVAITEKKQGLHDVMSGSLVVNTN